MELRLKLGAEKENIDGSLSLATQYALQILRVARRLHVIKRP
jgi:hypothetical protein